MAKNQTTIKTNISRQVIFPSALYELIEIRLNQLGISAPEYIRQLVIEDVKPLYKNIPYVDEETESSIGRALENVKEGRTKLHNGSKEIMSHLDNLSKKAKVG